MKRYSLDGFSQNITDTECTKEILTSVCLRTTSFKHIRLARIRIKSMTHRPTKISYIKSMSKQGNAFNISTNCRVT